MSEDQTQPQIDPFNRESMFEIGYVRYIEKYGVESAKGYVQAFSEFFKEVQNIVGSTVSADLIRNKMSAFVAEYHKISSAVNEINWNELSQKPDL
ncbi:MAG: hypothetical protein JSS82_08215 [Bacteroidetes bacterium]|nr:hypothetical protein [Bacteroidota bacterium]